MRLPHSLWNTKERQSKLLVYHAVCFEYQWIVVHEKNGLCVPVFAKVVHRYPLASPTPLDWKKMCLIASEYFFLYETVVLAAYG
jgi:hypothetical protein